jgi:predicted DNA-binding protein
VPVTIYIDAELNNRLNAKSKERFVGKSSIVRLAIERFLTELDSGQLDLPLGL